MKQVRNFFGIWWRHNSFPFFNDDTFESFYGFRGQVLSKIRHLGYVTASLRRQMVKLTADTVKFWI